MKTSTNRVMVICLDGATFDIIKPMVNKGELPHISALMRDGSHEKLLSTIPAETGPAFVTFMTGNNPGRHGITRFVSKSVDPDKSVLLNASHIACKTIWERLTEKGKKIIVVGVPFTSPPMPVNGAIISHWSLVPGEYRTIQTYPPDLKERLIKHMGSLDIKKMARERVQEIDVKDFYYFQLNRDFKIAEYVKQTVLFMMDEYEWDFMMFHLNVTDAIQHHFWKFMDSEHSDYDPGSPSIYKDAIFNAYRKADEIIGDVLNKAGEDITVLVMSDHGFSPISKRFHINHWLAENGFLKFNNVFRQKKGWKCIPITVLFRKIFQKLGLHRLSSLLPWIPVKIPVYKKLGNTFHELIDWNETRAWGDNYGININVKGREPEGIVSPGLDYEYIIDSLTSAFKHLKDPEGSGKIVGQIYRKEEIYTGPLINEGADIIPLFNKGFYIDPSINLKEGSIFDRIPKLAPSGHHTGSFSSCKGILIFKGKAINHNARFREPGIIDLAPTILYLMGLPVPGEMEGRVLCEAIQPEHLRGNPVIIEAIKDGDIKQVEREGMVLSEEETEAVKDQLRNLGYL